MEFLIFSDSHGRTRGMEEALRRLVRPVDSIFYLGDGLKDIGDRMEGIPVIRVRGNCDHFLFDDVPETECFTMEGKRLFLTHGAQFGVKSGLGGLLAEAVRRDADVVFFGHTHRAYSETVPAGTQVGNLITEKPILLFNPGSIGQNRAGNGFSFGTLTIQNGQILASHGVIA